MKLMGLRSGVVGVALVLGMLGGGTRRRSNGKCRIMEEDDPMLLNRRRRRMVMKVSRWKSLIFIGALPPAACLVGGGPAIAGGTELAIELTNTSEKTFGYVRIADSDALEPQTLTLEAWITPTGPGFGNTDDAGGANFIAKPVEGIGGFAIFSYVLAWRPIDGRVNVGIAHTIPSNATFLLSSSSVPVGTAAHVAMTFDGQTLRLFINCQLDAETPAQFANVDYGAHDVLIGAGNYGFGFLRRFQGVINDVRLWDHARDQQAIASTMSCPLQGNEPGLLAYYKFDAADATDDSGNGHNGVLEGTVAFVGAEPLDCPPPCPWDLDCDGDVGITDFLDLLAQWGQVDVPADFDGGGVGIVDFLALLANWGPCP